MRTELVAALLLLLGYATAGGYQGCLERLWVFYAYEIDGLNAPSQQTLGFKCIKDPQKPGPAFVNGQCTGTWKSCATVKKVSRCNFNQLMEFMGKMQANQALVPGGDINTRTPNIRGTAINVYNYYKIHGAGGGAIPNFPPQNFLKTTNGEYTDFIDKISDVVTQSASHKAGNQDLFDGFKEATKEVKEARLGDHGSAYFERAKNFLIPLGFDVKSTPVEPGQSPIQDSNGNSVNQWKTVDWELTHGPSGMSEVEALSHMNDFHQQFYSGKAFDDHIGVINAYKNVQTKLDTC